MDRVKERLDDGMKALATLEKVVGLIKPSDIERDAAIQRFEYTFVLTWKAAQAYLTDREFLEAASPRAAIRGSFQAGLFNDEIAEKFMQVANDRNLTVHTYKEEFAVQLYFRLATHAQLLRLWLEEIKKRIE